MPDVIDVKNWKDMTFKELGAFKDKKIADLAAFFEARTGADGRMNMDAAEVEIVRKQNQEITDATKRWQELREMDEIFKSTVDTHVKNTTPDRKTPFIVTDSDGRFQQPGAVKSLGERAVENSTYKAMQGLHSGNVNYTIVLDDAVKTLITTSAGFAPPNDRTSRVVDFALRRPVVGDLIPTDPTTLSTVKYMEETTFTNAAAAVAEGGPKPEAALVWTERSAEVEKIAVHVPVTTEQLDDVPQMQGIINNRLSMMLRLKEEDYLLSGTGVSPQITGFLVHSGVQTQATGGDNNIDATYKGFTKVRTVGFAEPTGVVYHPNNWTPIRLAKTLDGLYIWGHPSDPGPERIFGKTVIVTTAMTANTALTGDFQLYSHISRRQDIRIIVGYIGDQLIENKKTIVAEMRESLEIFRGAAFCKITGLGV